MNFQKHIASLVEKRGIILGYSCFINVGKLGYQGYKIYLKVKGTPERKKEFYGYLKLRRDVFWFGIADGAWDVGLTFFSKGNEEFYKVKNEIFSKFGDMILEKHTGSIIEPIIFGRKFLIEKKEIKPVHMFGKVEFNKNLQLKEGCYVNQILLQCLRNWSGDS